MECLQAWKHFLKLGVAIEVDVILPERRHLKPADIYGPAIAEAPAKPNEIMLNSFNDWLF